MYTLITIHVLGHAVKSHYYHHLLISTSAGQTADDPIKRCLLVGTAIWNDVDWCTSHSCVTRIYRCSFGSGLGNSVASIVPKKFCSWLSNECTGILNLIDRQNLLSEFHTLNTHQMWLPSWSTNLHVAVVASVNNNVTRHILFIHRHEWKGANFWPDVRICKQMYSYGDHHL